MNKHSDATPAQCMTLLAARDAPTVLVTLVRQIGSTPQDVGAKMLVGEGGFRAGTVGGGRVEHRAIEYAQELLADVQRDSCELVEWNLQRDIGMTCGGVVTLLFERFHIAPWRVVIFGAGHVAQSLVQCLLLLDCHIVCVDDRAEWLAQLPPSDRLSAVQMASPPEFVSEMREPDAVICMTKGHATDLPVLESLFRGGCSPAYLGVIGSASKRRALRKGLLAMGVTEEWLAQIRCPIGMPIGTNHPGHIAVSIAADLIALRTN